MRKPRLFAAVLAGVCGMAAVTAALAQPAGMPGRRAGMWKTTMSGMGEHAGAMTINLCVDPALERSFSPLSAGPYGPGPHAETSCAKHDAHRIAGGWAFESVCTRNGRTVTHAGTVTGDFQSHIHFELVSSGDGPARHVVSDSTWTGPCVAGEAQSMTLPDGRVITIPRH